LALIAASALISQVDALPAHSFALSHGGNVIGLLILSLFALYVKAQPSDLIPLLTYNYNYYKGGIFSK
jgi:hypothetical protein